MNNKEERLQLIREGSIPTALLKLSTPTIIAMLVLAIYNYVDALFVGMLKDESALAAIQVIMPAFQFIGAIGLTFGMGAASVISRKLGEKNLSEARKSASVAFYLALGAGLLLSISGLLFPRQIAGMLGATEANFEYSVSYGRVILGGGIFQVLNMCLNNILRSEGAAKESGMAQLGGALLNIALDPLFIFTLKMGITGAAVATVIAQGITTMILLSFFIRKKSLLHLSIRNFLPSTHRVWGIMQIGFPTLVRQLVSAGSFVVINSLAAVYGDAAQAAIGVMIRTLMIVLMVLFGLSQGLQPLAGYNFGAGRLDRTRASLNTAMLWTVCGTALASLIFVVGAHPLMRIFLHDNSRALEIGTFALRVTGYGLIPIGMVVTYGGYFQALGAGLSAFLLALFQQGLFMIPLLFLFNEIWGLKGMLAAQTVAFFLALILAIALKLRIDIKLHKRMQTNESA